MYLKIFFLLLTGFCAAVTARAQFSVSGTVFDSARTSYVENVQVTSNSGNVVKTDSMGHYRIFVLEDDSLNFTYRDKSTLKYAVKDISNLNQFDISLRVRVTGAYKVLKEVVLYPRSYRQDSLENRASYAEVYSFQKPTIRTSISPGGVVGADVNEIINMFRFKRNKRLKAFQARLEQQEQEDFVKYRFNRKFVGRVTQLKGNELDSFMVRYEPSYEFASMADEVTFHKYILNSSYAFKIEMLGRPAAAAKKEN